MRTHKHNLSIDSRSERLEEIARSLGELTQMREMVVRRGGLAKSAYLPRIVELSDHIRERCAYRYPAVQASSDRLKIILEATVNAPHDRDLLAAQVREEIAVLENALLAAANEASVVTIE